MDMCSWLSTTCVLKNPLCRPSVPMCSAMSPTGQRREMATHGKDGFGAMATGAKLRHRLFWGEQKNGTFDHKDCMFQGTTGLKRRAISS